MLTACCGYWYVRAPVQEKRRERHTTVVCFVYLQNTTLSGTDLFDKLRDIDHDCNRNRWRHHFNHFRDFGTSEKLFCLCSDDIQNRLDPSDPTV